MAPARTNEQVIAAYAEASARLDMDALETLRHPDWRVVWPQSGEEVHSSEAFAEIIRNYPGGAARSEVTRVVGTEDLWVVTPGNTAVMVAGSGDFWWSEWRVTYPDGETYLCVDLMELRDGRIWRETVYWASPFAAPEWRSPWVARGAAPS
jgi:ketosteroid isomerase-like protein